MMLPFFLFLHQIMNIALIGYGKMGKEIEQMALLVHQLVAIIDIDNQQEINNLSNYKPLVAIEFTHPGSAVDNIIACFKQQIPVVCGTTGWYDKLDIVVEACKKYNGTLLYSSNFSIGVNLYFHILKEASKVFKNYLPQYHFTIEETHHTQKKDSPSGTAITMAQIIMNETEKYQQWTNFLNTETHSDVSEHTLPIFSKRIENVVGQHIVTIDSEIDTLILSHTAKNRKGFAWGAIKAAEFIADKKGIYTMKDLLNL